LAVVVGGAGSAGVLVTAQDRANEIEQVTDLTALSENANDAPAENYLLVGSDSRADLADEGVEGDQIGSEAEVQGSRSDTIMILRREKEGAASLLSLPRDLWVQIAGTGDHAKINAAYNGGPDRLIATINSALGIPINHYVEVDFAGFTNIVNELDGVELCFEYATRDTHSGLDVQPGCQTLDGTQALAYTRSRYFEEFVDGDWRMDGRADLGRIERQQHFIQQAVTQVLQEIESDPFAAGRLIDSVAGSIRIDENNNPIEAANALRAAANLGLQTFSLPVEEEIHGGQSALGLLDGAEPILDYFRGTGPLPPPPTTPSD
jgi:LCP family protein required for cell wall assembly